MTQLTRSGSGTLSLFERKPIELDGFRLHARGVDNIGKPNIAKWQIAMEFAMAAEEASPFWVADLWNYAEGRDDWKEELHQAIGSIKALSLKTLQNYGAIAKSVAPKAKALAPSIAHADVVVALDPDEQVRWMDKASSEELTVRDLRMEVRAEKRRRVIEGQATLEGMYRVVYADPPWLYSDSGAPPIAGSLGKSERHYLSMSIEDLCKLPVAAHVLPDAVLFLWVTSPLLLQNPGPREVIEAWGFQYKTGAVWDKVLGNFGHYFHVQHEHLLVCTRGSCLPDAPTPQPKSVQTERRSDIHSAKPESFRKIIEKLYIYGPFLELFGRERVEGWDVFGNDARLWAEEAAQL